VLGVARRLAGVKRGRAQDHNEDRMVTHEVAFPDPFSARIEPSCVTARGRERIAPNVVID
jgi:hypothetical protein